MDHLGNAVSGSSYKSIQCRWAGSRRLGRLLFLLLLLLLKALADFVPVLLVHDLLLPLHQARCGAPALLLCLGLEGSLGIGVIAQSLYPLLLLLLQSDHIHLCQGSGVQTNELCGYLEEPRRRAFTSHS